MLSNLIGNGLQHGDPASRITVTVSQEADHTVIRVHNEGVPIPEATLPTIFDLAPSRATADEKRQEQFGHLGIGLFIVRKIVEAHSGTINVTSPEVGGTTFVVRLPIRQD